MPAPANAKADFGLSGALAQDAASGHTLNGVLLKWSEPPDAAAPSAVRWRLHVFKDGQQLDKPLHIFRQSAFLVGRERKVADIPADHPSCSGQHAVIQFRSVAVKPAGSGEDDDDGKGAMTGQPPPRVVKPYILDLESTNGTFLNGQRVPAARYMELRPMDVLKFGSSSREFVLMHDDMV